MSAITLSLLVIASLSTNAYAFANGNAFLKTNSHLKEESMSEDDVQTSLLSEVEATFGAGTASSRVAQLEQGLASIYAALPKNEKGYVGHAAVRYALHRLFVQRHGWVIRGLDAAGAHRNSTSSAGLLKDQVPAYLQDLFEKRLGSRGFGRHELAVVAATIEHLIHNEAIERAGFAFKVHDLLPTSILNESTADEVLETYMAAYILGEDLSKLTLDEAHAVKAEMPEVYMAWNATKAFLKGVRREVVQSEGSAEQKSSGEIDFSLVARVAEKVSEKFGGFQHLDCEEMKATLVKSEDKQSAGRVRLHDFYKPALDGQWQFQESVAYLRQLGALDETDPDKPRVIIVNYISSPTNSIASSNFYSVGCMDECEGLLGQLEQQFGAPEVAADRIAKRVAMLGSSSVAVPRTLAPALLKRLDEVAAEHGGKVPLHGRLFAQWMHHAFPRECPYPHISDTTNPLTPDEWVNATGGETVASNEEMSAHVEKAKALKVDRRETLEEIGELPWAPEEELLVVHQPLEQKVGGSILLADVRNVVLFMAMVSLAYGLVQHSMRASKAGGELTAEQHKFMV